MHTKLAFPLLAVLLIGACASTKAAWYKAGVSSDETKSALAECKYQVGLNKIGDEKAKDLIQDCMESKGFRGSKH